MKEKIIDLIKEHGKLSYGEILNLLECENYELAPTIAEMEDVDIYKIGKHYYLLNDGIYVRGIIVLRNSHLYLKTNNESIFVSDDYLGSVFDKDVVIAEIEETFYQRKNAKILKVVEHSNKELVCKMTKMVRKGKKVFSVLDPNSNYEMVTVDSNKLKGANIGDICIVEINYDKEDITGTVKKIIGHNSDIGSDVLALIAASKVPYIFPEEVYDELDKISDSVNEKELVGRVDFTNDLVITIDGVDSKDFDDAVSLIKLSNGNYKLSVHIADVSHYVKEGSAIDKEALSRGTSIYLVDRVIPMLPEKLSNGICSLNEGVIRLVLSCVMEFSPKGEVIDSKICSGYIKSKRRMTYEDVNKMLEDNNEVLIKKYSDIYPMLCDMKELSDLIRKRRENRGSLDFDIKEMKICVDEKGHPINVLARDRGIAEMLIEDFMLSANECIALTLYQMKYPCCYRVHEEPNKEKLNNLNHILKGVELKIPNVDKGVSPKTLQGIMNSIKGTTIEASVNTMLLRAMAKARYDSKALGHFGLASKYYCHFTSPIRRYPDLQTHRMINELIIKTTNFEENYIHFNSVIDDVCEQSSLCERKALDLERLVNDMKAAEYMKDKVGNVYNAIISSVTSFGLFVMLENTIEGLVHIKNMPDFYTYDEKRSSLIASYTKEVYNIGDRIKVRCIGANKENRQIDFIIVSSFKERK